MSLDFHTLSPVTANVLFWGSIALNLATAALSIVNAITAHSRRKTYERLIERLIANHERER